MERDLERLQNKEDSSDSLRRRLRETEVHTRLCYLTHEHSTHTHSLAHMCSGHLSVLVILSIMSLALQHLKSHCQVLHK